MADEEEAYVPSYIPESDAGGSEFTVYVDDEEGEKDAKDDLADRLAALEEDNRKLREQKAATPSFQPVQQNQSTPARSAVPMFGGTTDNEREQAIQAMNAQFAANPGEALYNVFEMGRRQAEEAAKRNMYPVAAQNARMAIQNYTTQSGMDATTREEFNKLVGGLSNDTLAQADPLQMQQQLDYLHDMAFGRAQRQAAQNNQRRNAPPPFTGGARQGSGKAVTVRMNDTQKYAWNLGKEQGLSDKILKGMLDNGELD